MAVLHVLRALQFRRSNVGCLRLRQGLHLRDQPNHRRDVGREEYVLLLWCLLFLGGNGYHQYSLVAGLPGFVHVLCCFTSHCLLSTPVESQVLSLKYSFSWLGFLFEHSKQCAAIQTRVTAACTQLDLNSWSELVVNLPYFDLWYNWAHLLPLTVLRTSIGKIDMDNTFRLRSLVPCFVQLIFFSVYSLIESNIFLVDVSVADSSIYSRACWYVFLWGKPGNDHCLDNSVRVSRWHPVLIWHPVHWVDWSVWLWKIVVFTFFLFCFVMTGELKVCAYTWNKMGNCHAYVTVRWVYRNKYRCSLSAVCQHEHLLSKNECCPHLDYYCTNSTIIDLIRDQSTFRILGERFSYRLPRNFVSDKSLFVNKQWLWTTASAS